MISPNLVRGTETCTGPPSIALDSSQNVYIADEWLNRISIFDKDGSFLDKWGVAGSGEGQFNLPWGLTIDKTGDIYVADWRNDRIQKFTADGQYLAEFGSSGSGVGEFNRPTGVAVDEDGDIYVADWRNDRVQVLTPDGRHITTFTGDAGISKWGAEKLNANPDMLRMRGLLRDLSEQEKFWRPKAIAVDGEGGEGDNP